MPIYARSEEHTSELQSRQYLHSFPTRRSSDLFAQLLANICVDEQTFESRTIPLDRPPSIQEFIDGSRQSLEHLRLAALSQIREAIDQRNQLVREDANLRKIGRAHV